MSNNNDVTPSAATEHLLGRVKWFNNKSGYGFITITDGKRSGTDVFVHHSAVNVENNQYKYLVQGEYVEFDLIKTQSEKHEWQASHVSGIKGGKLMCETRHELKVARNEYKLVPKSDEPQMPKQRGELRQRAQPRETGERNTLASRARGEGPRDSNNKKEWTLVSKNRNETSVAKKTPKPRVAKTSQEETK
jgi:CspA family cold shock protein